MEESLIATRKEKAEVEALTRQLETGKTKAALELQVRQEIEYPARCRRPKKVLWHSSICTW